MSGQESLSEADFVSIYGDYPIAMGPFETTLSMALAMEADACPADESKRGDPAERLRFLAGKVGSHALLPEHQYLLAPTDSSRH